MSKGVVHIPNEAEAWPHVDDWSRMDEIAVVFDCPHTTPTLTDHGPYVVRSQDIRGRRFDTSSAGRVSEETYVERIARAVPEYGDLLYSREGTYFGISAPVPRSERVCLGQRMTLLRPDPAKVDHIFLNYWLNSDLMERFLAGFRDGSVAQRLNMSTIRGLPVPVLPISMQRQIARTLQTLDEKIELNRRMSATLEDMARALYRSWFVDFDPVHARALGQSPAHMDAATASLFPDSFGPDGLPKEWRKLPTSELVTLTKGRSYKSKELQPSKTALISLKSFRRGGGYRRDGLKGFVGDYKANQVVNPGELVISLTDVTQAAEVIGRATFARGGSGHDTLVASLDVGILRPIDEDRTPPEFLHQVFNSEDFLAHALAHVTGTTVLHLAKNAVPDYKMILPEARVIEAFERIAGSLRERIQTTEIESNTLATLRDALLPRLMSGELRIREAEKQVEEVV